MSQLVVPPDQAKGLYDMAKMPRSVGDSWYLRRPGSGKMRPIGLKVSESEIANSQAACLDICNGVSLSEQAIA